MRPPPPPPPPPPPRRGAAMAPMMSLGARVDVAEAGAAYARAWFDGRARGTSAQFERDWAHAARAMGVDVARGCGSETDACEIRLPDETDEPARDATREAVEALLAALGDEATRASDGTWSFERRRAGASDEFYVRVDAMMAKHAESRALARAMMAKSEAAEAAAEAETAARRVRRAENRLTRAKTPRLREPAREETTDVLKRVYEALAASAGSGTNGDAVTIWKPSFGKARKALQSVWKECSESERVTVMTEYVMLHLGGSKYRAKCFEDESEAEEEAEEEVPEPTTETEADDEPSKKRGKRTAPSVTTITVDEQTRHNDANPTNGISLRVQERFEWDGRLHPPAGAAAADGVVDVSSCFVPWWNDVDVRDARSIGRWGEAFVYQYLLATFPARENYSIEWLNAEAETNSFYDIKVTNVSTGLVTFVEVKSTRFDDKNAFAISPWEWDFATKPSVDYHIYRVFNAGDKSRVHVKVVRNPAKLVREHKVGMALVI